MNELQIATDTIVSQAIEIFSLKRGLAEAHSIIKMLQNELEKAKEVVDENRQDKI